jgi:hypothetical protein
LNRQFRTFCHAAKAILCVALTLNLHLWTGGCGAAPAGLTGGWFRVDLPAGSALAAATRNSAFGTATALEVNPAEGRFRVDVPAQGRSISGSYQFVNGRAVVHEIDLADSSQSVSMSFDTDNRIVEIASSGGATWRPVGAAPPSGASFGTGGVDAYVAANTELVGFARGQGQGGGTTGGTPGTPGGPPGAKPRAAGQLIPSDPSGVLMALSLVTALSAYWPALYLALQIVVGVNLAMALAGGVVGQPGGGQGGGGVAPTPTGLVSDATLRVRNALSGNVPIWYVVLLEVRAAGLPGGNLLGEEAIPAGAFRDFFLPAGKRSLNIVVPAGERCLVIHRRTDIQLTSKAVVEIVLTDADSGELYPVDCQ